jgi:hypothetical protein
LAGWGSINTETIKRYVSHPELREVLLKTDEEFRLHILWRLDRLLKMNENGVDKKWSEMLPEFLRKVWPPQKSANTPKTSANLCNLTFSNIDHFSEVVEIILPFLTVIDRNHTMIPVLEETEANIIDIFPKQTLALLYTVLSDDVTTWPYGIEATLNRIGKADENLRLDERLIELYRRWNAR